jgi:hypothetical protein
MHTHPAVQTDPCYSVSAEVTFDPGAVVSCSKGWGNRHGRFYSPDSLLERIIAPGRRLFESTVHRLDEPAGVDASIYARFALLATRRPT